MNPRYTFIFFPVAALEQAACSPKTGEGHEKEWLPETLFVFVAPWPPGISLSMQHSTCEIDGILLFKGARTLSSWNKMLREGRNARSKGCSGSSFVCEICDVTWRFEEGPLMENPLVGKSLQVIWILNSL